jgi:hypothetical protein
MLYSDYNTRYATMRGRCDERRDFAGAAGARAQTAVSTGAVRQSRGLATGTLKQGDARREDEDVGDAEAFDDCDV